MAWRPWTLLRRSLLRRDRDDRELEDELRFHIEQEKQLQIERGASADDADRAARVAMGSVTLARENTRAVWVSTRLEQLLQDLRAGSRIVTRSPGLTAMAVLLIASVVGLNTTIFSVVHGILTKPAPGVVPGGMVTLTWIAANDWIEPETSYANYMDLASRATSVRLAGSFPSRLTLSSDNASHAVWGAQVSANYFDVLGLQIAAGRSFMEEEHTSAASGLAAIISHAAWQNYFQGRANIGGTPILLNGRPATIIGVAAPPFRGSFLAPAVDVWVPFVGFARAFGRPEALIDRQALGPNVVGRLRGKHSIRSARAELTGIWSRMQADHPEMKQDLELTVVEHSGTSGGNSLSATAGDTFLGIFSILTLITLLIVCANVANLLIGRAIARQREMALRQSLGASRGRIIRVLLAEGMAISALAWGVACLFAWWVSKSLLPLIAPGAELVAQLDVSPDWTVVAYALTLAAAGMIAVTIAPALRAWRQPLLPWLKSGEQGIVEGRSRLSTGLVVLQLAFSVLLLVTAGLAYRSVSLLGGVDLGYSTQGLLLATVRTGGAAPDATAGTALLERLRERLEAVPGIAAVSYARRPPEFQGNSEPVRVEGAEQPLMTEVHRVGPDYLRVFGLAPVSGTDMRLDRQRLAAPAVVTRSVAEALWPGQSPLGRTLTFGAASTTAEIIGVAPDAFLGGYRETARPRIVLVSTPAVLGPAGDATFYIRHTSALDQIVAAVHREVRQTDPLVPVVSIRTFESELSGILMPVRLITSLLAVFGAGCLLIAAAGQYAAVSFDMSRRVRDVGLRMALGASSRQVLTSVLVEGFRSTAVGLAIGFLLSAGVATALGGILYGITPTDGVTYVSVFALLAFASLVACLLPARRAARIEPIRALRYE